MTNIKDTLYVIALITGISLVLFFAIIFASETAKRNRIEEHRENVTYIKDSLQIEYYKTIIKKVN